MTGRALTDAERRGPRTGYLRVSLALTPTSDTPTLAAAALRTIADELEQTRRPRSAAGAHDPDGRYLGGYTFAGGQEDAPLALDV